MGTISRSALSTSRRKDRQVACNRTAGFTPGPRTKSSAGFRVQGSGHRKIQDLLALKPEVWRLKPGPGDFTGTLGFTLIELLVVVAILGILAAIAIPQYMAYRQTTYDARAVSDLRTASHGEEAYFATFGQYVSCADLACETQLPDFRLSATVSINMAAVNGTSPSFTGTAQSSAGRRTFTYDSAAGGMQE
jgi:type IV pilus assembly protein PilA